MALRRTCPNGHTEWAYVPWNLDSTPPITPRCGMHDCPYTVFWPIEGKRENVEPGGDGI
jgi:hypothetical protein